MEICFHAQFKKKWSIGKRDSTLKHKKWCYHWSWFYLRLSIALVFYCTSSIFELYKESSTISFLRRLCKNGHKIDHEKNGGWCSSGKKRTDFISTLNNNFSGVCGRIWTNSTDVMGCNFLEKLFKNSELNFFPFQRSDPKRQPPYFTISDSLLYFFPPPAWRGKTWSRWMRPTERRKNGQFQICFVEGMKLYMLLIIVHTLEKK